MFAQTECYKHIMIRAIPLKKVEGETISVPPPVKIGISSPLLTFLDPLRTTLFFTALDKSQDFFYPFGQPDKSGDFLHLF